ncbi:helix-turn-helix domain-containing protein [Bacteroides sp. OM08-17BH]|uniref:helix-turn-helix domain-containing protein n=1 Tax=Bacteroides sp. OM08-17BH TaxID=2292285 RepID=UPI000E42E6E0|nr:helix-turn-helix domain-containing protein [Bacteroides sp. OM08-17BH]RGM25310.1 DNA-binding protein [Bacteroides sp. OM08-17BH]
MGRSKNTGKVEPVNKLWLSAKEAMAYLGCSDKLLEKLRNDAEISFSQYNKRTIWYELRSLDRFIERNRVV